MGRPGIGGGFDSSHRPVVGNFDRFNGLSSNILLTLSCYFDNPQMPCGGALELKRSARFKCPAYALPPPQRLNIDRCIRSEACYREEAHWIGTNYSQKWLSLNMCIFYVVIITRAKFAEMAVDNRHFFGF